MKILSYKEIQELAGGETEIEATKRYIVNFTAFDYTSRLPYFLDLRMRDPENPFIIIQDMTFAIEYAGYLQDAQKEKWFSTYQAAFEPEAEWVVKIK